jgi:hypothetical protein
VSAAMMITAIRRELMFSTNSASAYSTIKYTLHLYGAPYATTRGANAANGEASRNLSERHDCCGRWLFKKESIRAADQG